MIGKEPNPLDLGSVFWYTIGVESRKEKDMNDINDTIATYEANLRGHRESY